jgi:hypothetical protein
MIRVEIKGIKELQERLDPRKVEKAARSALTRVKTQAKTEAVRSISKVWNIRQGDLLKKGSGKERIQASGYIGSDLTAYIHFYSGGISLAYFGATEFRFKGNQLVKVNRKVGKVSKRRGDFQGVKVQLLRGGKAARLRGFMMAVAYGKNSGQGYHLGVFSRHAGGKRLPVYERKMISVATMVRKPEVIEPLKKFIGEKFNERFSHELKRQGLTK